MQETKSKHSAVTSDREVLTTRIINASPERVFDAWTKPEQVAVWWGPRGFTTTTDNMEVKPGGVWEFTMHGPDGRDYPNKIIFLEVDKPNRLVYKHSGDEDKEPVNFHTTVTFENHDGKTRLTLRAVFDSAEELDRVEREHGAKQGAVEHVDRLEEYVSAGEDLLIVRTFNAPREKVWKAWIEPELFMKWWGPAGYTSPACEIDLKVGGKYLACMRSSDGNNIWSTGVYLEIKEPEKLVFTDCFSDEKGNVVSAEYYGFTGDFPMEMKVTVILEEYDGKTRMTIRHEGLPAGEHTQGANIGWNTSLDKMEEILK